MAGQSGIYWICCFAVIFKPGILSVLLRTENYNLRLKEHLMLNKRGKHPQSLMNGLFRIRVETQVLFTYL